MPLWWLTFVPIWLVCANLQCWGKNHGKKPLGLVFKVIPTLLAAGLAFYALLQNGESEYIRLMLIGLLLGAAADVLLNLVFVLGGVFFFAGHVFYILAFTRIQAPNQTGLILFVCLGLVFELSLIVNRKHLPKFPVNLGVGIYVLALAALASLGIPPAFQSPSPAALTAALGSGLFILSDLTLSRKFLGEVPVPYEVFSLCLYYAGQTLLGLSALLMI